MQRPCWYTVFRSILCQVQERTWRKAAAVRKLGHELGIPAVDASVQDTVRHSLLQLTWMEMNQAPDSEVF